MNKQSFVMSALATSTLLFTIILTILFSGCSKEKNAGEKFVATVNKEIVSLKNFQRDLAVKAKQNPSYRVNEETVQEQLNSSIDRKLMVQEAMKMGLASHEDFVRTIQIFWEQTLIRELIEAKNHEWKESLFVTEEEVRSYYEGINSASVKLPPLEAIYDQIKKAKLAQKRTDALEEWLSEVRSNAIININDDLLDKIVTADDSINNNGGNDGR
jgi:hypothetical protein